MPISDFVEQILGQDERSQMILQALLHAFGGIISDQGGGDPSGPAQANISTSTYNVSSPPVTNTYTYSSPPTESASNTSALQSMLDRLMAQQTGRVGGSGQANQRQQQQTFLDPTYVQRYMGGILPPGYTTTTQPLNLSTGLTGTASVPPVPQAQGGGGGWTSVNGAQYGTGPQGSQGSWNSTSSGGGGDSFWGKVKPW